MKLKHWIKIIVFALISIGLIAFASVLLCVSNERDAVGVYGFFKEPKDSISVVLVGPSTMYTSFYSPLAYEKYGFTSYNLATSSMTGAAYKSVVQVAEAEQNPDLYIVEIWGFCYDNQLDEASLRKWLDSLPASDVKNQAIEELIPEEEQDSYKFPFIKYHARWDDLEGCLKVLDDKLTVNRTGFSITKNFATDTGICKTKPSKASYRITDNGFTYLKIFLDYCREANIENILFVRSPEYNTYEPKDSYYQMLDMIKEAGYDFLDLEAASDEMGIDDSADFYNATHFNIFGAEKYTKYLSEYILQNYDIKTDYEQSVKDEWDYCAAYNKGIIGKLESLTEEKKSGYRYTQKDFLEGVKDPFAERK